ncbi:MAG: hypothetical protein KAQ63_03635 [Candidatus Moranbacteria bacterium]|nr:hypothetical protein [Candidatus Moranbacteria bacterium]
MKKSFIFFPIAIAILILAVFLVNKKGEELSQPVNFIEATQPVVMDNPELNESPKKTATITDQALGDEAPPPKHTNVVPFTSQAPYAKWDRLHDEACEEASIIMAHYYLTNQTELGMKEAEAEIQKMVTFQKSYFGSHKNLTAKEMIELTKEFYQEEYYLVQLIEPKPEILVETKIGKEATPNPELTKESFENIKNSDEKEKNPAEKMDLIFQEKIKYMVKQLSEGSIFIIPAAGQVLENPYFRNDGPLYHALVVVGYDNKKEEFIVNDPGTRRGEGFRYSYENLWESIRDFTGRKADILEGEKNVILVKKNSDQNQN